MFISDWDSEGGQGIIKVVIKDKKSCPRYMACLIEGVKVGPSPKWLQDRLIAVGFRPINNIVDITNYLLYELGQPMHAFDKSVVSGQRSEVRIIIRKAKKGESIITIDGMERKLERDMLVIADSNKPIAVAGVMGGAETEVSNSTTSILLESAYFNPISINKTSKALKLRTESSVRFEHGVDWDGVEKALNRGAQMIIELAGGTIKQKIDIKSKVQRPRSLKLRIDKVNKILGTKLTAREIKNILQRLRFKVSGQLSVVSGLLPVVSCQIPLCRAGDIEREIDIIEEIARVYGYEKIKETLPNTSFGQAVLENSDDLQEKIREVLIGYGFSEVKTISMISPKLFANAKLSLENTAKISNPLTEDESIMRTSLIPSLLSVVDYNLRHQVDNVAIFEIGKVFSSKSEKLTLGGVILGSDFLYLKGIIEELLHEIGISNLELRTSNIELLHPGKSAEITALGCFGLLHPDIKNNFDINKEVYIFEIDLDAISRLERKVIRYKPLPKFPASVRDIAMFVPQAITHENIVSTIKEVGGNLIEEIILFDRYQNSLAYRIVYRDAKRTLTDEEINAKQEEISQALVSRLKVQVRK